MSDTQRPNVIFMLADDLGWGDVGFHGSSIRTPNIDRLERHGVELAHHYVCPVCTPTRVSLMSGCHPGRFGRHATRPSNPAVFREGQYTLARLFKDAGYDTGLFGKWHIGSDPKDGPYNFGFDYSYGSLAGGVDPYSHLYKPGPYVETWHRNGKRVDEPGHVTDLITDEAIQWMENRENPFFCYLPFTAVHTPVRPPEEWFDRYADVQEFDDPEKNEAFQRYAAYTSHMDHAVGRVVEMVKRLNILDQTIIIFCSDNGSVTYDQPCDRLTYPGYRDDMQPTGCNAPLRGRKHTLYEGGVRTPTVFSWRNHVTPGKRDAVMHMVDWMPSFANLLGMDIPNGSELDGVDMWSVVTDPDAAAPPRSLYWNLAHRYFAIREDGWKLIVREAEDDEPLELFRIDEDPFEKENVAAQHPDVVDRLKRRIEEEHARDDVFMRDDAPTP